MKYVIDMKYLSDHGFHEEFYPDQNSTFLQYNFSVRDLICIQELAKESLSQLGVELDDPALIEVSESNEVHIVYGFDMDCVIGPFHVTSKEGKKIMKNAIKSIKTNRQNTTLNNDYF